MAWNYLKNRNPAPKLITLEITFELQKDAEHIWLARDLVEIFGIERTDAAHRLRILQRCGIVKYADIYRKARGGYILTDYGKNFKDLKGETKNATRGKKGK